MAIVLMSYRRWVDSTHASVQYCFDDDLLAFDFNDHVVMVKAGSFAVPKICSKEP